MARIIARKLGQPEEVVYGVVTDLSLNAHCEDWTVPSDHSSGHLFDDWLGEYEKTHPEKTQYYTLSAPVKSEMEAAWQASITHHTARLRRIGWLDQKGRVWTEIPATADFDGGSLTPLLIDVRGD